jgi:outer membrane protein TolC
LCISSILFAQIKTNDKTGKLQKFNPLTDNVEDVLPPLSVLLDSAVVHSAQANYESLHAMRNYYEIVRARQSWTQYLGFNLDGGWGNWETRDRDMIQSQSTYGTTNSFRWNYDAQLWVRYPLSAAITRSNEIKFSKKEMEMSLSLRDQRAREARLDVIRYYNAMLQAQSKLKISNDYQSYTMIQMKMADMQFLNKEIEVAEYARLKEIQTRGAYDFEQFKSDFSMNYQLLEETTGIKFNLINELK